MNPQNPAFPVFLIPESLKVREEQLPFILIRKGKGIEFPQIVQNSFDGSWPLMLNHLMQGNQRLFIVNGYCFMGSRDERKENVPDLMFSPLLREEFKDFIYAMQSFAGKYCSIIEYRWDIATPALIQQYRVRRVSMNRKVNLSQISTEEAMQEMQKAFEGIGSSAQAKANRFDDLTILDEFNARLLARETPAEERQLMIQQMTEAEKEKLKARRQVLQYVSFAQKGAVLFPLKGYTIEQLKGMAELPELLQHQ